MTVSPWCTQNAKMLSRPALLWFPLLFCLDAFTSKQLDKCLIATRSRWRGWGRDVNQQSKRWCLLQGLYEPGQLCLTPCTELLSEGGGRSREEDAVTLVFVVVATAQPSL